MTKTRRPAISIAPNQHADDSSTSSKGQRASNTPIKQIENRRKRLADWEATTVQLQRRYAGELLPLGRSRIALQIRSVHSLDQVYERDAFIKAEHRKMSTLIVDLTHGLIDEDANLKALYNKYSGTDFDREAAMQAAQMKARLEAALGVGLDDDVDVHSEEVLLQHVHEHLTQWVEKKATAATKRGVRRAARKKSSKQLAAETQEADEQAQISLPIREVYRKLASALYPSRETDPRERERRMRLMQRVSEVYDKNNLLQLLELQFELEHIDQHSINRISEARLTYYSQVLKDQMRELDRQIHRIETIFRHTYGHQQFKVLLPDAVLQKLDLDIVALRQQVRNIEQDLAAFDDFRDVRRVLKPHTTPDRQSTEPRVDPAERTPPDVRVFDYDRPIRDGVAGPPSHRPDCCHNPPCCTTGSRFDYSWPWRNQQTGTSSCA